MLTCEANVLVFYSLDVEPDGGDGGHHLAQLELVKNRRLTSCIQTHLAIFEMIFDISFKRRYTE